MRKEPKCQKRVQAGLHRLTKHRLLPVHVHILSWPKRGQPYICFHCPNVVLQNTRTLKLLRSCWQLMQMFYLLYTSLSLLLHHLLPPVYCQIPLQNQAECLSMGLCGRTEASLWSCGQSCSSACISKLGIWQFQLWSQRQLDFQSTTSLDFTGCLGHLGLGRTWVSLQKCNNRS